MARTQVALIDEVELGKNYPLPFSIDNKRLESTIILSQRTKLRDFLGDKLYFAYLDYAEDESLSSIFDDIDSDIRMLLCMYVAANLYRAYYADKEQSTRDFNMNNVNGDVKFYELIVMNQIKANPTLAALVAEESINEAETEPVSTSGIYYPN